MLAFAASLLLALPALATYEYSPTRRYALTASDQWATSIRSTFQTTCRSILEGPYPSLADIPGYPNVAGTSMIQEIRPNNLCGTCWNITYEGNGPYNSYVHRSKFVTMIDTVSGTKADDLPSFTAPQEVLTYLTDGYDDTSDMIAWFSQVDASNCGF